METSSLDHLCVSVCPLELKLQKGSVSLIIFIDYNFPNMEKVPEDLTL